MNGERDPLYAALRDLESSAPFEVAPSVLHGDRRRWVAAGGLAAAAVIVGAMIGSGVLDRSVGRASQDPTPMSDAPTPSVAPTSTPLEPSEAPRTSSSPEPAPSTAPSEPSRIGVTWEQVAWPEDEATLWLTHDAELGRWFMGGQRTIWTSTDRTTWEAASVESAGCDGDDAPCNWAVSGVARLGDRLVAVGLMRDSSSDGSALASWVTDDGIRWSLTAAALPNAGQSPSVAASNGTVLMLVAGLTSPEAGTTRQVSSDGVAWERLPGDEGVKLYDVHGDDDGFVAVGEQWTFEDNEYRTRPIVQSSTDGREWTTVTIGEPEAGILTAVTRTRSGGYVAAGRDADRLIFTWRSGDGGAWQAAQPGRIALPDGFEGGSGVTIVATELGLVLAGVGESWTSVDGISWNAADAPGDIMVTAMESDDGAIAAAGRSSGSTPLIWSLWSGELFRSD